MNDAIQDRDRHITQPTGIAAERLARPVVVLAVMTLALPLAASSASATAGSTTRVSVSSSGAQAGGNDPAISADGRFVAFQSQAPNLVAGDTNAVGDIFVRDRDSGTTTRVSVSSGGGQGNGYSYDPAISGDGRFVAFESQASNLVAGDTNVARDVFVHDRDSGTTTRVSVSTGGAQADNESRHTTISGDGRYVAFESFASNLVAGDTNGTLDVFVYDRDNGTTSRVSVTSSGSQGNNASRQPAISRDGRYVAFMANASNLVAGDTNGRPDVFVHDRQNGTTTAVSVNSQGGLGDEFSGGPAISADGRYVAFESAASNLVPGDTTGTWDVFIHDRQTGGTTRVASGGGRANDDNHLALSTDGRYVAFESSARAVVPGDTNDTWDVFVHDRQSNTTQRVSVDSNGGQGNNASQEAALSGDGRSVAFQSQASNLVSGDTNAGLDVFVHELRSAQPPPPAPTVALTDPVNGANQAAVEISGGGQEGTSASISVDDSDPATAAVTATADVGPSGYTATLDLSSLGDGTLTATVTLMDAAGGTSSPVTATTTKDTRPPASSATVTPAPNAAGWNNSDVAIDLFATDTGTGVRELAYSATGAQAIGTTTVSGASASVAISAEGETLLSFFASDNADNQESAKTVAALLDKTPPSAAIDTSRQADVVLLRGPLTGTAADHLSGVAVVKVIMIHSSGERTVLSATCTSECGTNWAKWSVSLDGLRRGHYTASASAIDLASNVGSESPPVRLVWHGGSPS